MLVALGVSMNFAVLLCIPTMPAAVVAHSVIVAAMGTAVFGNSQVVAAAVAAVLLGV